jgi:C-terminal processing protease CtpA/Prc
MRRLLFFIVFVTAFALGTVLTQVGRYRDVFRSICDLTAEHFYRDDAKLKDWFASCRKRAASIPVTISNPSFLDEVQDQMNLLNVSHFSIYSPAEDRKLWKGEAVDTGIRSRFIEDRLVVYHVFAESSAARAGVKPGDEIKELPGIDQVTPWGAEHRAGWFTLSRRGKKLRLNLVPTALNVDSSPQVEKLSEKTALLTITSFRSEYFSSESWRKVAAKLRGFSHVIVDVRENSGGNFVAMLRALSTFQCEEGRLIGSLVQPRRAGPDKPGFDDDTDDTHQLGELENYHSIQLKTFKDYGCFRGKVTVLISSETSSVAEIFADNFNYRPNSRVWGQPSAGDVVLAVWYDLPALGPGYSFSVPEAVYMNREKKILEGQGVYPQKDLYYDLELSLAGQDSWLVDAMKR